MNERKRSPQFPSISLSEAICKADKIYEENKNNLVNINIIAKSLGYNRISTKPIGGVHGRAIAALGYYGLLLRDEDGQSQVSIDYKNYKLNANEISKRQFLEKCLKKPKIFALLIDKYGSYLPLDSELKDSLIKMNFSIETAGYAANIYKESIEFFLKKTNSEPLQNIPFDSFEANSKKNIELNDKNQGYKETIVADKLIKQSDTTMSSEVDFDSVPLFLPNGRKTIINLPKPFNSIDKKAIIRQLNAIWTSDETVKEE